jgi:hypothetical protein
MYVVQHFSVCGTSMGMQLAAMADRMVKSVVHEQSSSVGPAARGLHSFPFPLILSLPCPFPLNLSLLCPPYDSN